MHQDSFRTRAVALATFTTLIATVLSAQAPVKSVAEDLAAEMSRFPAVEAKDAIKTFAIQDGYELELVASEPLVSDPVDACFDERGRMFVAEMHGYPYSFEVRERQPLPLGKKDAGIIRMLEDTDADGLFDKSVVFADKLSWPTSVACYDGGIFVLAPDKLYYLKDTDGDNVADKREVVMTGFPRSNVQGLANNMKWTLDNRITFATGTNGGDLDQDGQTLGSMRGRDLAFDPRDRSVEFLTGGRQFGMGIDDWNNRFVCTNSNHIQHVVFEQPDLAANPAVRVSAAIRDIAAEGAAAPVFRTSPPEPWRIVRTRRRAADPNYAKRLPATELVPVGFFTSATGVTIYRGDADPAMRGQAIIGDVGGNLVHRKTLTPNAASFLATRVDEGVEFITSTDTWFRPVNFVNAPDGCLYILDMYRETIEHPASIPEDIKEHVDLQSGHDRGRIWRLKPPGWTYQAPQVLANLSSAELVQQLASPNSWNRDTAQRLLVTNQDKSVTKNLRQLAKSADSAIGRVHAVATLQGLNELTTADVVGLLNDSDTRNQSWALRLWRHTSDQLAASEDLTAKLEAIATSDDPRLRVELALTLRTLDEPLRSQLWQQLASTKEIPGDLRTALLLSANIGRDALVATLAAQGTGLSGNQRSLLFGLIEMIGGARDSKEAVGLLNRLMTQTRTEQTRQLLLTKLGEGLRGRSSSLIALLKSDGVASQAREAVGAAFEAASLTAADADAPLNQREQSIGLLAHAPFDLLSGAVDELLSPQAPQRLQTATVAALKQQPAEESGQLLLNHWETLSPAVRKAAVDAMLSQTDRTKQLLAAIKEGRARTSDLETADRELLLNHPRKEIRDQATTVLGQPTSADRVAVIEKYAPALDDSPDLENGKAVFKKVCFTCHKIGEEGHVVGPDLTSVANKSPEDLMIALLDPNREAQPRYASYTILTVDGRVLTGLIAAESAESVTLRRAEGKEDTVRREDIELMKANGVSLMPAGLEKDLSPRQIADVIALVRSLGVKQKEE